MEKNQKGKLNSNVQLHVRQAEEDLGGDGDEGDWGAAEAADDRPQDGNASAEDEVPGATAAAAEAGASDGSDSEDDVAAGFKGGGFRYRKVPKADYGLSIMDMLTMDPKELNQVGRTTTIPQPNRIAAAAVKHNICEPWHTNA